MYDEREIVHEALANGFKPDPYLPLDEWSDQYMFIPRDSGANEYGKYRTSRTPHARKPMQCLSLQHRSKRTVVMGASQMLKSQIGLNFCLSTIHMSPANFIWAAPTGKLAKRASTRIAKTIAAVPEVAARVAPPRSRDAVNTLDIKEYVGGALYIITAGSAANLSELPARFVVCDEIDRLDENVDNEGDPISLLDARQTSFHQNRKSYFPSSPTIEDESAIEKLFKQGTQREALAECTHCGHVQELEFERLEYTEDKKDARYQCPACFEYMYEHDKTKMFVNGLWSDGIEGDGETESFHITAMFLPYGWMSWHALLKKYDAAKEQLDLGNEEPMKAFWNTRLAKCWKRKREKTKSADLKKRAEKYKLGTVPAGGLVLTAAIDTQTDRLELVIVAWGEGMECWVIDYRVIYGDPVEESTWEALDKLLKKGYRHESGQLMEIKAAFVDSGGQHTHEVYNFTRSRQHRHIFACKGSSKYNRPVISAKPSIVDVNYKGELQQNGAKLWYVGPDTAKDYYAARWKLVSGPSAIHFSLDLSDEFYDQLTSEHREKVFKGGKSISVWKCKDTDRNEVLDCMVYNLAAAHYLSLHKFDVDMWRRMRNKLQPTTRDMFDPEPEPDDEYSQAIEVNSDNITDRTSANEEPDQVEVKRPKKKFNANNGFKQPSFVNRY